MLAIKFKRVGKKHQASFRVVVAEKRSKLNGRFVDDLGWFNPKTDAFEINKEKTMYWIGVGAQPTASIHNLLNRAGVIKGKKIAVHKKAKVKKGEAVEMPVASAVLTTPSASTGNPIA